MILSHRVSLNGTQMDSLDDSIIIQSVEENTPKYTISGVNIGTAGQRMTQQRRDTLDLVVKFAIRLRKDNMAARDLVFDKIVKWALPGGTLMLNTKTNKCLNVVCVSPPGQMDPRKWDTEYQITFRAFGVPYWEQVTPSTQTVTASSGTYTLANNGTANSPLEVQFKNTGSATINLVTVRSGGRTIRLESLGLAAGETFKLYYQNGLQKLTITNAAGTTERSVMAKRTDTSADDIWLAPGNNSIAFTASASGALTLSCRGRFA